MMTWIAVAFAFGFTAATKSDVTSDIPKLTSKTPLSRHHKGDTAEFYWKVDSNDTEKYNSSLIFYFIDKVILLFNLNTRSKNLTHPGYRFRIEYSSPAVSTYGFKLPEVTLEDSGVYSATYVTNGNQRCTNQTVLFVFGQPSTPSITQSPSRVQMFAAVTLICEPNLTSLPVSNRPTSLVTWYIDGRQYNSNYDEHIQNGTHLAIHNVTRDCHQLIRYTCVTSEKNSSLDSPRSKGYQVNCVRMVSFPNQKSSNLPSGNETIKNTILAESTQVTSSPLSTSGHVTALLFRYLWQLTTCGSAVVALLLAICVITKSVKTRSDYDSRYRTVIKDETTITSSTKTTLDEESGTPTLGPCGYHIPMSSNSLIASSLEETQGAPSDRANLGAESSRDDVITGLTPVTAMTKADNAMTEGQVMTDMKYEAKPPRLYQKRGDTRV